MKQIQLFQKSAYTYIKSHLYHAMRNRVSYIKTKTFLVLPLVFAASILQAQSNQHSTFNDSSNSNVPKINYAKNNFKVNVTGIAAFGSYGFTYERLLTRKLSLSAGYKFLPSTQISESVIGKNIDDDIKNSNIALNAFTIELKKYTGRHPGARGFYFSVYGRYANFDISYPYSFTSENSQTYNIPINAKMHGIGGGLMLGSQWIIAKHAVIDFFFLGSHYGSLNGNGNGVADLSTLSANDKLALQQNINSLININDKQYINSTVTDNGVQATLKGPFIGVRAGISLGIAF